MRTLQKQTNKTKKKTQNKTKQTKPKKPPKKQKQKQENPTTLNRKYVHANEKRKHIILTLSLRRKLVYLEYRISLPFK